MTPEFQLVVLAKSPQPGRVKTRLCPPYSLVEAARLAAAAIADTVAAVLATPAARRVMVLDGPVGSWLPAGFDVLPQRGDGLDERLAAAFDDAYAGAPLPILLIGMDTPQVTAGVLAGAGRALVTGGGRALVGGAGRALVTGAGRALVGGGGQPLPSAGGTAVLGAATDGGWWALGLPRPDARLLLGVPMSSARTGAVQRRRLIAAGLTPVELPVLTDVDTAGTAREVAAAAPASAFASALLAIESGRAA